MKGFRYHYTTDPPVRCHISKRQGKWIGECLENSIVVVGETKWDCFQSLLEILNSCYECADEIEARGGVALFIRVPHYRFRRLLFDLAMWWKGTWEQYTENRRWDKAMRMNKDPNTCWWLLCSWVQEGDKETRRMLWQEGFSVSRCYPGNPFCSPGDYGCGKCDPELKKDEGGKCDDLRILSE